MVVRLLWVRDDGKGEIDLGLFESVPDAEAAKPAALADLLAREVDQEGESQMHTGSFVIAEDA